MINKEDSLKIGLEINRIASVLDNDSFAKVKESLRIIENTLVRYCGEVKEVKKADTEKELCDMLLSPMHEALKILKDNDMHELVSFSIIPDGDYISFFCSDTGNHCIKKFNYFESDKYKEGSYL